MKLKRLPSAEFRALASDSAKAAELSNVATDREEAFTVADSKAYEKALEVGDRDIVFRMSDGTIDRHNDTIDPAGWKFEGFLRSGSMIWAHDASQLPIAKPVELWIERGALFGQFRFPAPGKSEFADTVFELFKDGTLRGVSVGFSPKRWEFIAQRQENGHPGVDFKEQELLELSATPVPANSNAVVVRAIEKLHRSAELAAVRSELATVKDLVEQLLAFYLSPVRREGRVLSKTNEGRLEQARDLVDQVLSSARPIEEESASCDDADCDDPNCENPDHMKTAPPPEPPSSDSIVIGLVDSLRNF